jgi:hypothetical protein
MSKSGAYPLNPATAVGQVRLNVGDSIATLPAGQAPQYAYFSDAEITAFLTAAGDDPVRATGFAYLQLAASFAMQGKSIKTDDQAIDTKGRGKDLLEVAQSWLAQADAAANDFFDIANPYCLPEVGF